MPAAITASPTWATGTAITASAFTVRTLAAAGEESGNPGAPRAPNSAP
jgi:hypothetical protein